MRAPGRDTLSGGTFQCPLDQKSKLYSGFTDAFSGETVFSRHRLVRTTGPKGSEESNGDFHTHPGPSCCRSLDVTGDKNCDGVPLVSVPVLCHGEVTHARAHTRETVVTCCRCVGQNEAGCLLSAALRLRRVSERTSRRRGYPSGRCRYRYQYQQPTR